MRALFEVSPLSSHVLLPDEVGPEDALWKRSDVEVEIVDLILTRRVSEEVQSYEAKGRAMPHAVDTHVLALHEAIVDGGE